MRRRKISRAKLASRMNTNRATLDRLFSYYQNETSLTLQLFQNAALGLSRRLKIELA